MWARTPYFQHHFFALPTWFLVICYFGTSRLILNYPKLHSDSSFANIFCAHSTTPSSSRKFVEKTNSPSHASQTIYFLGSMQNSIFFTQSQMGSNLNHIEDMQILKAWQTTPAPNFQPSTRIALSYRTFRSLYPLPPMDSSQLLMPPKSTKRRSSRSPHSECSTFLFCCWLAFTDSFSRASQRMSQHAEAQAVLDRHRIGTFLATASQMQYTPQYNEHPVHFRYGQRKLDLARVEGLKASMLEQGIKRWVAFCTSNTFAMFAFLICFS